MSDTEDGTAADADGTDPRPVVRRAESVAYEPVDAADGLSKGVLLDASDGAPHFAMRRFTLAPGAEVPRHTNAVEHEQYVLAGEYVVGLGASARTDGPDDGSAGGGAAGGEEYRVGPGDSLLIPAGTVHWYRNVGDEEAAFICVVPNGDDAIELVDE
ncbi:MAG: cupin domain-containing protein [Haloferacaceae archaeon]